MNEEMNRREAELSEAALGSVSGGKSHPEEAVSEHANGFCSLCDPSHCGGTRYSSLYDYMKANGMYSVTSNQNCPYYKR